jgi:hypothetical protein
MIYREYEIEAFEVGRSQWHARFRRTARAQARGFGPVLTPSAKVSSLPLPPGLNWAGAATCRFSLTGRWFRGAAEGIGRENRAAHRRSHRL